MNTFLPCLLASYIQKLNIDSLHEFKWFLLFKHTQRSVAKGFASFYRKCTLQLIIYSLRREWVNSLHRQHKWLLITLWIAISVTQTSGKSDKQNTIIKQTLSLASLKRKYCPEVLAAEKTKRSCFISFCPMRYIFNRYRFLC